MWPRSLRLPQTNTPALSLELTPSARKNNQPDFAACSGEHRTLQRLPAAILVRISRTEAAMSAIGTKRTSRSCPFSGVKRTSAELREMSAYDPKRTSGSLPSPPPHAVSATRVEIQTAVTLITPPVVALITSILTRRGRGRSAQNHSRMISPGATNARFGRRFV
jgi:hypothetical protein